MIKNKTLKFIIILVVLIYICSYYVSNSGYYEYHLQEKTVITNEKIKEFESDIQNNEAIDIKEYLVNEDKDYSNKVSNIIYNISVDSNKVARKIIKTIFKKLSYLVED